MTDLLARAGIVVTEEGRARARRRLAEVLADEAEEWPAHAALWDVVGRADAASAMLASLDYEVDLLAGAERLYAGVGSNRVIPIEEPDD